MPPLYQLPQKKPKWLADIQAKPQWGRQQDVTSRGICSPGLRQGQMAPVRNVCLWLPVYFLSVTVNNIGLSSCGLLLRRGLAM